MDYGPILHVTCMITGLCHEVDKICAFLVINAVYSSNSLPTFGHGLSVPFVRIKPLKVGLIGCTKSSVRNYHYMPH